MKSKLLALCCAVALCPLGVRAQSDEIVIDFEALQHAGDSAAFLTSYVEDGFELVTDADAQSQADALGVWGTASENFNGSTALFNNSSGGAFGRTVILTNAAGAGFALLSIDLGPAFVAPGSGAEVLFEGRRADGSTVTQQFAFSADLAPGTFAFASSFSNLVRVSWQQADAQFDTPHQFDNIRVAAIPEPATAALMLAALALLAGWRARMPARSR
jgi:hypothetical protein